MEHAADRTRRLDPARIAGISTALTVNLAVALMLLHGIEPGETPTSTLKKGPEFEWFDVSRPPIPPPQPPPLEVRRKAEATPAPAPIPVAPIEIQQPGPMDHATPTAPTAGPILSSEPARSTSLGTGVGAGAGATLGYEHAPPPRYPRQALQRGWQGTVWLRVHVDAQGRPVAVDIHQGSGHGLLDRTAREQVLKRWRFVPAVIDGNPVPAQGLVPIDFLID